MHGWLGLLAMKPCTKLLRSAVHSRLNTPWLKSGCVCLRAGWNCCATQVEICGGVCCDNNRVCLLSQCVAQGSIPCGSDVCQGGQTCNSGVCCSADRVVCGSACCEQGQQCINGQCAATGSTACGGSVCDPTQTCATGICCPAGQVSSMPLTGRS